MAARQKELEAYQKRLPDLAGSEGKYVLIIGDDIAGTYDAYADALAAGYEKAKLDPFLVKRISAVGSVGFLTRDVECRISQ